MQVSAPLLEAYHPLDSQAVTIARCGPISCNYIRLAGPHRDTGTLRAAATAAVPPTLDGGHDHVWIGISCWISQCYLLRENAIVSVILSW